MSSAYSVLINKDLLKYISDYNTDASSKFIKSGRPFGRIGINMEADSLLLAIIVGNLEAVKKLHGKYRDFANVLDWEVKYSFDYPHILVRYRGFGHMENIFAVDLAAAAGHLSILQWLLRKGVKGNHRHTIKIAASNGHIDIVKWLYKNRIGDMPACAAKIAAAKGHLDIVKWLCKKRDGCDIDAINEAIANGHLHVVEWLFENLPIYHKKHTGFMFTAIINNHLHVAEWLREKFKKTSSPRVLSAALICGHMPTIEWAYRSCNPRRTDLRGVLNLAAGNGTLEIIEWIYERFKEKASVEINSAIKHAVDNGHLNIAKWLHAHAVEPCNTRSIDIAANHGFLDIVEWLHGNCKDCRASITTKAMDRAAANGHLHIVEWLHHNSTIGCTTDAMDLAAANGHLHIVQWLHHNRLEGCTVAAMNGAAQFSRLRVIKWLHENRGEGCDYRAIEWAARNGNHEVIEWLYQTQNTHISKAAFLFSLANTHYSTAKFIWNNCCKSWIDTRDISIDAVAFRGDIDMIKWLHNHAKQQNIDINLLHALQHAADGGHLELVKWLYYNSDTKNTSQNNADGSNIIIKALKNAAASGHLHVIEWLYDKAEICAPVIYSAIRGGHLHIVKWLYKKGAKYMCFKKALEIADVYEWKKITRWLLKEQAKKN